MRRILGAAAALAALLCGPAIPDAAAQSAPAPTPAVTMWGPNESGAMARVGNTLYVAGGFDYLGLPTGSLAIVDAADATQVNTNAALPHDTSSVIADGTGGWFLLTPPEGGLSLVPIHILPSGAVDPGWSAPTVSGGRIETMVADNARLYLVGTFSAVGGAARQGIAALDIMTGALSPWTSAVSVLPAYQAFADGGVIYVWGGFDSRPNLNEGFVALDGTTGTVLPFATPHTSMRAASGNRVYGLGPCGAPDFQTRICAFDRSGVPLPTWTPPVRTATDANYLDVKADANRVYVLDYSGVMKAYDALSGARLTSWTAPVFNTPVVAFALDGGTLYAVGLFSTANGQARRRVAALDGATGALTPWAPPVGGFVGSVAAGNGRVALAGSPSSAGGITTRYLAALDLTTGLPLAAVPTATRPVRAIATSGDLVLAAESDGLGGELFGFSAATGAKYPAVVPFTGTISVLEFTGTRVLLGGWFSFGAEPMRSLAAFDLVTGGLLPWNPTLGPTPNVNNPSQPLPPTVVVARALAGRLYVGGRFSGVDGNRRGHGAAFDLGSQALMPWDPQMEGVNDLELAHDRLLVAGLLPQTFSFGIRWMDPASGDPLNLPIPQASGSPTSVRRSADLLVIGSGGGFAPSSSAVTFIDPRSGQPLPWPSRVYTPAGAPSLPGGLSFVNSLLGFDDLVILRGVFSRVGQQPAFNLAVLRTSPPAPPRNLTFDATQPVVAMAWTAAPGATPTAFVIEAGTAPGLGDLGRFPVGPVTQVSALVGPGAYSLRVFASGPTGTSAASSEILFTRPAPATAPNAPAALSGSVVAGVVSLDWTASTDAVSYVIEVGSAAGLADIAVLPTGVLDTNAAGAVPAGTYFVRVRAANRFGLSAASNEVRLVVPSS